MCNAAIVGSVIPIVTCDSGGDNPAPGLGGAEDPGVEITVMSLYCLIGLNQDGPCPDLPISY